MRGIAAIAVMLFHFDFAFIPSARLSSVLPISHAYLAVDLFFLLSGYVMAHVYGDKLCDEGPGAWISFGIARLCRLYPLFLLTTCILVAIIYSGMVTSKYVMFDLRSLVLQPLMLQPMRHGLNWNYPSWSIGTEVAAYVIFVPAAPHLLRGRYPWAIAVVCIAVLTVLCGLKGGHLNMGSQAPAYARTFAGFTLGVLLFRAYCKRSSVATTTAWIALLPLIAAWAFSHFDVFLVGTFAALLILIVQGMRWSAFLDWVPFRAAGDWSYGIYMWHAPVHFGVIAAATAAGISLAQLSRPAALAVALGTGLCVVIVAGLGHTFYEVPLRRALPTVINRLWVPRSRSA
jgi:peptidoglycan/LPS O-acetylase OafA/YrhL